MRSARLWSRCSLSLVIERAKSTGMEVNRDFTSKETMTSSLKMECCVICCVKTEQFCTVKVFFLRGDRTETRYLDTTYVGLPILLVMGRNGLPGCGFWEDRTEKDAGVELPTCSFLYKFGPNCGAAPLFSFLMLSRIL